MNCGYVVQLHHETELNETYSLVISAFAGSFPAWVESQYLHAYQCYEAFSDFLIVYVQGQTIPMRICIFMNLSRIYTDYIGEAVV